MEKGAHPRAELAPCKDHEFMQQPVSTYYVPDIVPGTGEDMVSRITMTENNDLRTTRN